MLYLSFLLVLSFFFLCSLLSLSALSLYSLCSVSVLSLSLLFLSLLSQTARQTRAEEISAITTNYVLYHASVARLPLKAYVNAGGVVGEKKSTPHRYFTPCTDLPRLLSVVPHVCRLFRVPRSTLPSTTLH